MVKIGSLYLEGRGKRPISYEHFKEHIRNFAKELGLQLVFVSRNSDYNVSWCDVYNGRAVICETYNGRPDSMNRLIEVTLHEIAHWIQFNEGMFSKCFGEAYYGGVRQGSRTKKDLKRLSLRMERHADKVAAKLMKEFYGMKPSKVSCYRNTEKAKKFLAKHYEWDQE